MFLLAFDAISQSLMKTSPIFLDYNATTPLAERVKKHLIEGMEIWGNPSSVHWASRGAKQLLRESRQKVADIFSVSPLEIIFTSGGSESNNTVIRGVFENCKRQDRCEFITTAVEHPSVVKTMQWIESQGAQVHRIQINRDGVFDWDHFQRVLSSKTALVSMMFANNETGLLLPINKIVEKAHATGALVHTDAVQAFGKMPLNLKELGVDFASFSAHKFYALKGTGLLYVKKGYELPSLICGGGQERHRRGGTENTLGIYSLSAMAGSVKEIPEHAEKMRLLRDNFEAQIAKEFPDIKITHKNCERLSNTSNLVLPGVDGESLLMNLDLQGCAVSTGSACSSGSAEPSPTLISFGLSRGEANSSLRISLGWDTTAEQMQRFFEILKQTIPRLRKSPGLGDQHV